jgi:hypothetical protein
VKLIGRCALKSLPLLASGRPPHTTLLVENREHAHAIAQYLPSWELDDGAETPSWVRGEQVIAPLTRLASGWLAPDVVIFAAGTGGERLDRNNSGIWLQPPKLIIDVADGYDELARRQLSNRLDVYGSHGWSTIVAEPSAPRKPR